MIWDALNHKAKVLAIVERASVGKDEVMSSEEILKRMFHYVENACKQVKSLSSTSIVTFDEHISSCLFILFCPYIVES